MVKVQSGLPDSFDISVSAEELTGPAKIPGYLDEDPVVSFAKLQRERAQQNIAARAQPPEASKPPPTKAKVAAPEPEVKRAAPVLPPVQAEVQAASKPTVERKRFQINLDADSERMLEEMLDLLSSQCSENRIKSSELFQALLMNLYKARGEIALGSLPVRGRWGSPTAKAFPVSLAESFREAIVAHDQVSGGNPFKKAVGG